MFRLRPDAAAASITSSCGRGRGPHDPRAAGRLGRCGGIARRGVVDTRHALHETGVGGERAPYCMMGVCFDCLAEIDGVPNRQSCMVTVQPGMRIRAAARPAPSQPIAMTADLAIVDLVIVGAGPAGMAAAVLAGELGLDTVADRRAGQPRRPDLPRYRARRRTRRAKFAARRRLPCRPPARRGAARQPSAIPPGHDGLAHRSGRGGRSRRDFRRRSGGSKTIACRSILLATGAVERPVPIPGWTLPGVMTAGAAQILLKTADLVPSGRTVIAGQGPLLYLAAIQLARAGALPLAVLETTRHENYAAAARHIGGWWPGRRDLVKGFVDDRRAAPARGAGATGCSRAARVGSAAHRGRGLERRRNRHRSPAAA